MKRKEIQCQRCHITQPERLFYSKKLVRSKFCMDCRAKFKFNRGFEPAEVLIKHTESVAEYLARGGAITKVTRDV